MNLSSDVKSRIVQLLKNVKESDYFTSHYNDESKVLIGDGGFGYVYKIVRKKDCETLAVKQIDLSDEEMKSGGSKFSADTSNTRGFNNLVLCCQEAILQSEIFRNPSILPVEDKWIQPNDSNSSNSITSEDYTHSKEVIITFLQSCVESEGALPATPQDVKEAWLKIKGMSLYLVMECYEMDLTEWLRDKSKEQRQSEKTKEDVIEIFKQLTDALAYIHQEYNYVHYDLKPDNVLVRNGDFGVQIAITDFGLSRLHNSPLEPIADRAGTIPYNQAPDSDLTEKFDMWSFGLIVYELISLDVVTMQELKKISDRARIASEQELSAYISEKLGDIELKDYITVIVRCLLPMEDRVSSRDLYVEYTPVEDTVLTEF